MAAPSLTDDEILATVREITACRLGEEAKRRRYAGFVEAFPLLFDKACMGPVDEDMLRMMLRMRQRMATDKISEDDANSAVGLALAKQYVEPTLRSLSVPPHAAAASTPSTAKRPRTSED